MIDRHRRLIVVASGESRILELDLADAELPLTQVLRHHGLPLNTRCGDRGLCEGCTVTVDAGELLQCDDSDVPTVPGQRVKACCCRLGRRGDVTLTIPDRSLTRFEAQAVDDFSICLPHAHDPLCSGRGAGSQRPSIGVAVDIGTTTLALVLIDLDNGAVIARGGAFNRQIDFGDNVLTRINLCMGDADMVRTLQEAVVGQTLTTLLRGLLESSGVPPEQVCGIAMAGNTTMLHLLCAEDPSPIGVAPFRAAFLDHKVMSAAQIGLKIEHWAGNGPAMAPQTPLHLLPSASAYVGADIVAGVVATGMRYDRGASLLIDVGTNGEMVLCHNGQLTGCATAAGPAFEGGGLGDGMGAGDGAISHFAIRDAWPSFEIEVIGDTKPIGICGSAYIDFLAEARRAGVLNAQGRLNPEAPALAQETCGRVAILAHGLGRRPIKITEGDLAGLLQAKAAIAAGVATLLEEHDLTPSDLDHVYLAGGFGRHVNIDNAIACGLLPGFSAEQVSPVGNLSLAGAYLALMDQSLLQEMSTVARMIRIIELNHIPAFEDHFIDHLTLSAAVSIQNGCDS